MILLVLIGVFLISISGYMSYALFSTEVTSDNTISLKAGNIPKIYHYTGDYQVFNVSKTGYYKIEAYGAQGGDAYTIAGGKGGYTEGTILLNEGEKLYIYVGENYNYYSENYSYNGGGKGSLITESTGYSSNGGGASDIRYFGDYEPTAEDLLWDSTIGLNSRIMIAAGGGGATNTSDTYLVSGGTGGGLVGSKGNYYQKSSTSIVVATGGTQISGGTGAGASAVTASPQIGTFGVGGSAYAVSDSWIYISGGGGGYYGGGSGGASSYVVGSGAGGSSFISGYAGVNAITSSADRTHTNNTLHYSGKYFLDAEMKAGFNEGHGKVKISYFGETAPERINEGLDNVRYIRNCTNGNSTNDYNQWTEFQAIYNGENVAHGLTATGITNDSSNPIINITDGNIVTYGSDFSTGEQCVTIDLGQEYDLEEVAVWHVHGDGRIYYGNTIYTSSDNSTWTNVLNKVEKGTSSGIRINAYEEYIGTYSYTGGEQTVTVANTGCYGFELWGASAGGSYAGKGGYTYGTKMLDVGTQLFINIGGKGASTGSSGVYSGSASGGYNGGGNAKISYSTSYSSVIAAGGGGATHIATASGLLKNLSSMQSSVIAVAGAGGGGTWTSSFGWQYGGDGGGYQGDNGNATNYTDSSYNWTCQALGGKQEQTYSNYCGSGYYTIFGLGRDTIPQNSAVSSYTYGSGGGGGWYGGGGNFGQSDEAATGAGGSGYIGGMNKDGSSYMYCYTCSTSSNKKTLTYSTSNYSGYAISKYAKTGNGAARIYYLGKTCPTVE